MNPQQKVFKRSPIWIRQHQSTGQLSPGQSKFGEKPQLTLMIIQKLDQMREERAKEKIRVMQKSRTSAYSERTTGLIQRMTLTLRWIWRLLLRLVLDSRHGRPKTLPKRRAQRKLRTRNWHWCWHWFRQNFWCQGKKQQPGIHQRPWFSSWLSVLSDSSSSTNCGRHGKLRPWVHATLAWVLQSGSTYFGYHSTGSPQGEKEGSQEA